MARLSSVSALPLRLCHRRSAAAAWCWDCRRAAATRLRTAHANRRPRPALGRRNELGPAPAQSGIVDTSSDLRRIGGHVDDVEVHARHQIGQQGDGLAARWRQHRRGRHAGRATVALRDQVGHAVFVETDSHDVVAKRRPPCRQSVLAESIGLAGSLVVAVGDLQCPVVLQLELQDGTVAQRPVGDRGHDGRFSPVGRLGAFAAPCNMAGSRSSFSSPTAGPSTALPCAARGLRLGRRRDETGQRTARTGRSIDALIVLVRRRPVVADAGIDDQRHRERGGAFHHLAGHVLGLVDLLVGHLEQQFVVHLQQHAALELRRP